MPSLADRTVIPGSAPSEPELDAVWALLERAVTLDPTFAPAHATRGTALVRRGSVEAARRSYALAARFDPYDAPSRLALGELATMAGNEAEAQAWFAAAFALQRIYSPSPSAGTRSALVLCLAGPWHRNIPLDFIVDPNRWALHRWYLPDPTALAGEVKLPDYDVVIDAIGASVDAEPALEEAGRFIATQAKPALNAPHRVLGTARDRLADTLGGIPGCAVASVRRVARDELTGVTGSVPLLVRPTDAHGGRALERLDDAAALAGYAARAAAGTYDIGPFVDYRSADGYYRKYRVMFVAGEPYPYHLAIDTAWMIHYHRTVMAEPWMRDEESSFLTAPAEALGAWNGPLRAVGAAAGLDYFGIDCTVLADGTLFVFEADAAMLVHGFDAEPVKRAAYERIRAAFATLLDRRTA